MEIKKGRKDFYKPSLFYDHTDIKKEDNDEV